MKWLVAFVLLRLALAKNALRARTRGGAAGWTSLLVQVVAGVLVVGLVAGAAFGLSLLARAAPAALHGDSRPATMVVLRVMLLIPLVTTLMLPFVSMATASASARTRLLLMPIPRRLLHAIELLSSLADPWLLATLPPLVVLAVAVGAAEGLVAGVFVGVAAALFAVTLAALSTLLGSVLQLTLRDRRRSELVAVGVVTVIVGLSLVPVLLEGRVIRVSVSEERAEVGEDAGPPTTTTFPAWLQAVPSEALAKVVAVTVPPRPTPESAPPDVPSAPSGSAWAGLAALLAQALVVSALSGVAWKRLVGSPATSSRRRRGGRREVRVLRLPLVGEATAAVAETFVRTSIRTVAGKLAFLLPLFMVLVLGASDVVLPKAHGEGMGLLGGGVLLLGLQPFLLNVLAVDGPGLSRLVLSPLDERTILRGKLLGGALMATLGATLAVAAAAIVRGWPGLGLALASVIGTLGAFVPLAVAGAFLSILLPKAVDLGRLGNAGQPHQGAAVAGLVLLPLAMTPPVLLGFAGVVLLHSPAATLGFELGWLVLVTLLALPVLDVAAALQSRRIESVLLEARRP